MSEVVSKPIAPEDLAAALARLEIRGGADPAVRDMIEDLGPAWTIRLVETMLSGLQSGLAGLAEARAAGDLPSVWRGAHQLKGAAGNFSLPELVVALERVEHLAYAKDQAGLDRELPVLEALAMAARRDLTDALLAIRGRALMPAAQ